MVPRTLLLLSVLATADLGAQTVIANYRDDYVGSGSPAPGWQYLWNAPAGWGVGITGDQASGFIGAPEGYRALVPAVDSTWTADGDTTGGNNAPSGFLRLSSTGGHPGLAAGTTNKRARYAIAAYTVATAGYYAIENSFITVGSAASDGVEVLVFPGRSEAVLRTTCGPASTTSFDIEIGHLESGQTIYVAFGPGGTASSDAFTMDFDVVRRERLSFKSQLLNGIASGAQTITILPGRYFVTTAGRYLTVNNFNPATPVTIIADGVELVSQTKDGVLRFNNCSNLTLQGLSIDYDPQLYRQGTVESRDYTTRTFHLRLHEGYPQDLLAGATSGITYDTSLRMKQMTNTLYPIESGISEIEPGLYAVTVNSLSNMTVGDNVTLTNPAGNPHTILLENCSRMRFENIEIHGSPAFALLSRNGYRIHLENVQVTPGPTPLRASVQRLLSSNADGLHFKNSYGEITVNNCQLAYNGDDGIILTSSYAPILTKNAANAITVATKSPTDILAPGDELYLYDTGAGTRESATIQTASRVTLTETEIRDQIRALFPIANLTNSTFEQAFLLTLDSSVTTGVGGLAFNRSGESSGSVISNNSVDNTRARGILIKASNVVVRNNSVFNSFLPGIQLRPEADYWMEGDFAHDVIIEDNELTRCSLALSNSHTPIYVSADGFASWNPGIGHSNLTIRRNKISTPASGALLISYADDVNLRSNSTSNSHNFLSASPFYRSVIRVERARNVGIYGVNLVSGINEANANMSALIDAGPQVTNLNIVAGLLLDQDKDLLPDAWEIQYFGNVSAVNAGNDTDGDGLSAAEEFLALLNPLVPDAFTAQIAAAGGLQLSWTPKQNRFITVHANESLDGPFSVLELDIPAEDGVFELPPLDAGGSAFYRLEITD